MFERGTARQDRESRKTGQRTRSGLLAAMSAAVAMLCIATYDGERLNASVTAGPSHMRAADFNPYGINNDSGMVGLSVEHPRVTNDAHAAMPGAGIGWVRYWMSWQNIEGNAFQSPSAWNWSNTDRDIDAAIAQGMNVYVTILSAPSWVYSGVNTYGFMNCGDINGTYYPNRPGCGSTAVPFDSGHNVGNVRWKNFVTEAVKRYGNRVKYWGFWNEAANPIFWPEQNEPPCDRFGQFVKKVLRPGREAALAANPSVQIVGPEDDYGDLLQYTLEAERDGKAACGIAPGRLFDIISFHAYPNNGVFLRIDPIKNILSNFDRREVWLTEAPTDTYIDGVLEQFKQRGWISKIFPYVMRNGNGGCGNYGLLDVNFTPCYGLTAMRNFALANPPSMRFADLVYATGQEDFLMLANPHASAATVRIRFSTAAGASTTHTISMPANSRATPYVSAFWNQYQAASIWTDDPMKPVWAEHVNYWNNREAGRAAQGASERSDTWYFAEGTAGSGWVEYISAYNPSPTYQVTVTWTYINTGGAPVSTSRVLPPLGMLRLATTDTAGVDIGHSTIVSGAWTNNYPSANGAPISAERTISWGNNIEGHGGKGVAFTSPQWHFAEGANNGVWSTYISLMNPTTRDAKARVRYLLGTGFTIWYEHDVPARRRISFPADVNDVFGIEIRTVGEIPIAAERAMYFGAGWTVGTAGEGAPVTSQRWLFPEGTTYGGYFSTYFLLANPTNAAANLTITYRREVGGPVTRYHTLGAGQRLTIDPYADPDLVDVSFSTEVVVTGPGVVPPGIVAERAMYWVRGSGWIAGDVALGIP